MVVEDSDKKIVMRVYDKIVFFTWSNGWNLLSEFFYSPTVNATEKLLVPDAMVTIIRYKGFDTWDHAQLAEFTM